MGDNVRGANDYEHILGCMPSESRDLDGPVTRWLRLHGNGDACINYPAVSGRREKAGGFDYPSRRKREGREGPFRGDMGEPGNLGERPFQLGSTDSWGGTPGSRSSSHDDGYYKRGGFFIHGGNSRRSKG